MFSHAVVIIGAPKRQHMVPVLSALVIAITMLGLRAASGAVLAAPPQFNSHYVFAPLGGCRHSASAACRRRPVFRVVLAFHEGMPNGSAAATPAIRAGSLQLQGDADALRVKASDAPIADVLTAIGEEFHVQYRSSITLDEPISGTYSGSLSRVIGRLLAGYDYVIKRANSALEVTIFEKHGERRLPAALVPAVVAPVRRGRCSCPVSWPPPFATRLSQQNRCSCRS